uniref:Chitin-binding type-2 domain-containing protein n=1 Tax=Anopheles atroparvus TaxID=41427 RepID=A0AAG5DLE0_ANOAO
MLGAIFIVSLAVLVAEGATIDPRCLRYSQGMEAQVLPYLQDCRKFVICDMGGNGQVLSCPQGLYFDAESHACSFDTEACTHGELTDGTKDAVPPVVPEIPVHPQPQVPVPLPVQPQPQVPVQPQPLPVQPKPVQPIQPQPMPVPVQPPNLIPPVVAPEFETQHLQNICWDQAAGKVYPVANDCGLYVVCMGNGKAIVQRCPKGLLYDGKQQRCDFAASSSCATPRVDGNIVLDMHGVDMSLREDEALEPVMYAVPVVPVDEIAHQPVEIDVLHQQQPILIVPEPEQGPEPAVEYNFRIIDNHPRCLARANPTLTVELPHETDCSKYLVCVGRAAIEKQCPAGQHWSTRNNWCDFASIAGCQL